MLRAMEGQLTTYVRLSTCMSLVAASLSFFSARVSVDPTVVVLVTLD